jgi:threonyl-tRNA synthetase
MEEAEKRDHRKLGRDLDFSYRREVGIGLVIMASKRGIIWRLIEDCSGTKNLRKWL